MRMGLGVLDSEHEHDSVHVSMNMSPCPDVIVMSGERNLLALRTERTRTKAAAWLPYFIKRTTY